MKRYRGITLIALVITIIVLLILAGVSLNLIANENGVLKRATGAVRQNWKAEVEEEEESVILEINEANNIVIAEGSSNAYPMLTEYGMKVGKNISIENSQNEKYYYSLDNGNTWREYKGVFQIDTAGEVKFKKIIGDKVAVIKSEIIDMQLAEDALTPEAYDGDEETCDWFGEHSKWSVKILLDSTIRGKKVETIFSQRSMLGTYTSFNFYDENENLIKSETDGNQAKHTVSYEIPENATSLLITRNNIYNTSIYEISIEK